MTGLTQSVEAIEKRIRSFHEEQTTIRTELESVIGKAQSLLGELGGAANGNGHVAAGPVLRKRRTLSAAARKAISDAQKARWAAVKRVGQKR